MAIFESMFDVAYLCIVITLGIRLLPIRKKGARSFGIMAIILGLGDAFHLLPTVVSHLSPGGFAAHGSALSWGKFVTGITMTLFYVMFYYYYRNQTGDMDNKKRNAVFVLAVIRIALILLPQNEWGRIHGNYMFGIYRNIPFAILGGCLIYWSFKEKMKPGMKYMALLVFLSFLFYLPVVLWSDSIPVFGALMIPKTIAYLLIVVSGYRYFIPEFKAINILNSSFGLLIMGFVGGVFYREFTKLYDFAEATHLGKLHVHTLVLGFLALLLLYAITKKYGEQQIEKLKKPLYIYLSGLTLTLVSMTVFGIYEIVSLGEKTITVPALEGISGLGHITLSVGLVWLIAKLYRFESDEKQNVQTE